MGHVTFGCGLFWVGFGWLVWFRIICVGITWFIVCIWLDCSKVCGLGWVMVDSILGYFCYALGIIGL